jgi:hypothetical protein
MLDGEQVMGAAAGQAGGVAALGVHGVRGDDRAGDADAVQQHGEPGNLVRLGTRLHLARDGAVSMVEGGQQVITGVPAAG